MTKDKDLKRLIRARMEKTGESYTAARAQIVSATPRPLPDDYGKIAGMSDAAVRQATGWDWPEWTEILDSVDGTSMEHRAIAAYIGEHYPDVGGWWSQMITVAYERFRGLRDVGQRRGGGYDVNKSKTFAVSVEQLWEAVDDPALRSRWLDDNGLEVSTASRLKSMRARFADDTRLSLYFTKKGPQKCALSLQHRRLPDKEAADIVRELWGERLSALSEVLTDG